MSIATRGRCCFQSEWPSDYRKWEDVDHEDSLAGQLAGPAGGVEGEGDPLGLGAYVECVHVSFNSVEELSGSRASKQCEGYGPGISFVRTPHSSVQCVAYLNNDE